MEGVTTGAVGLEALQGLEGGLTLISGSKLEVARVFDCGRNESSQSNSKAATSREKASRSSGTGRGAHPAKVAALAQVGIAMGTVLLIAAAEVTSQYNSIYSMSIDL